MIVINLEGIVMGSAPIIERVNAQNEIGLIKVNMFPDQEFGYWYLGTDDRDTYIIYDGTETPDPNKEWKVRIIDGEFIYEEIKSEI